MHRSALAGDPEGPDVAFGSKPDIRPLTVRLLSPDSGHGSDRPGLR